MTRSKEIDWQEAMPDCPDCGHNVFVHRCKRQFNDWICEGCNGRWSDGDEYAHYAERMVNHGD